MDRNQGAIITGVVLLMSGVGRLEHNAIDEARRDVRSEAMRMMGHSRRRIDDGVALGEFLTGAAILGYALYSVYREHRAHSGVIPELA